MLERCWVSDRSFAKRFMRDPFFFSIHGIVVHSSTRSQYKITHEPKNESGMGAAPTIYAAKF